MALAFEALVAGQICLDIIPPLYGAARVVPGRTIEAGPVTFATGGSVANTGLALHRLGISTRLVAKIGDDLFGEAVGRLVAEHNPELAQHLVVAPGQTTAYTIILSPRDVDRSFVHWPGSNATFAAADVADALLESARLLHFGYPPIMARMYRNNGADLVELMRRAKAAGATTSVDMCLIDPDGPTGQADWPAILAAVLPYVDVFLPSVEEMLLIMHGDLFRRLSDSAGGNALLDIVPAELIVQLGRELLDLGARVVGLKAGERGMYLATADQARLATMGRARPADQGNWAGRELWAPCYAADVAGTTGSGDATIAGFLMGLLQGMSLEATLGAACAVGACCVEAPDALSGVRDWQTTAARIARGWPRRPLVVDAPGWRFDPRRELWVGPRDTTS